MNKFFDYSATTFRNTLTVMAGLFALASISAVHADVFSDHMEVLPEGPAITQADVENAQKAWGDAVVAIGAAGNKAAEVAEDAAASA